LVPAFFALSGFLVLGSALRLRATGTFLAYRALRIFPALVIEVFLSALLLGPLLTTVSLYEYLTDPEFTQYFGNMLGWVTFALPGMFENNPVAGIVNVNLWTLPSEFHCYLITAVLLVTRIIYNKWLFALIFLASTVGIAVDDFLPGIEMPAVSQPPHMVEYYFLTGALFFHFRQAIPTNFVLFAIAAVLAYGTLLFNPLVYLAPVPLTYCTVFFGLTRLPRTKLVSSGDYSYGIYLYGFPIAQTYISLFPGLKGQFLLVAVLGLSTTFIFAAGSWHLMEKHAVALKARLPHRWFPPALPVAKQKSSSTVET
jgi:peptidoglycan/LPS O-acetylase OafA/YrhL